MPPRSPDPVLIDYFSRLHAAAAASSVTISFRNQLCFRPFRLRLATRSRTSGTECDLSHVVFDCSFISSIPSPVYTRSTLFHPSGIVKRPLLFYSRQKRFHILSILRTRCRGVRFNERANKYLTYFNFIKRNRSFCV